MTEKDFIQEQFDLLTKKLRVFPKDFLPQDIALKPVTMPSVRLNLGEELFGTYELIDSSGNTLYHAKDIFEAKFVVYSSRGKQPEISLPTVTAELKSIVLSYEKYIDSIIKEITGSYARAFPAGKNALSVMNEILRLLDVVRF